ncbi:MAG: GAF domain-containing SpoIIE family protein phosphatase [Acidobacteriota bacterium]
MSTDRHPETVDLREDSAPGAVVGADLMTRRLALLHKVGQDITSTLDRDCLLEQIADAVERLIDFQLFALYAWDEDEHCLELLYARRSDGRTGGDTRGDRRSWSTLAPGEGMCGRAADSRQVVRVGDVWADRHFLDCGDPDVRSAIALPLLFEDRLLGVLDLESHLPDFFDEADEQFLEILASSIAVALANAELYERLRADERRLAEDLATAREVQRVLLPRQTPWVPGVELGTAMSPARELGGDVYDTYRYADGRLAVMLGDVAGKGAGAALFGTLALGLLRGWVSENACDPVCVLDYLDEELYDVELSRRFLAMAYAVIDPHRRVLTLANAGLPYAIVVRATGEIEEIELGGVPLGALPAIGRLPRHQIELALAPGDLVILSTDGITEALDADGRAFGLEGVVETVRDLDLGCGRCVAEALIAAADRHRGTPEAADDRTVVTLRLAAES